MNIAFIISLTFYPEHSNSMDSDNIQLEQGATPENENNDTNMETLLEREGLDIDFPRQGEIREGIIASISPGQILVSIGAKSEGMISGKEYDMIPQNELANLQVVRKFRSISSTRKIKMEMLCFPLFGRAKRSAGNRSRI